MASLEVVYPFPSEPKELLYNKIKKRWNDLKLDTKLPIEEFLKGLDTLISSLYFQFDTKYYQQIDGLPIGLSLSPSLVDLVLQDLEENYLKKYNRSISFYCRYVDDSFI